MVPTVKLQSKFHWLNLMNLKNNLPVLHVLIFLSNFLFLLFLENYIDPIPQIFDEFSYLLLSDTFLSGRLCNPPLLGSEHFENINLLTDPCYISRYLPLQGLILALGNFLMKNELAGIALYHSISMVVAFWAFRSIFSSPYLVFAERYQAKPFLFQEPATTKINYPNLQMEKYFVGIEQRIHIQTKQSYYNLVMAFGRKLMIHTKFYYS